MDIKGNTVLITGGATGIGLSIASSLLKAGNKVIICGRKKEKLEQAQEKYSGLDIIRCDITEKKACENLVK